MGVITQLAPFQDSVVSSLSASYSNTLVTEGGRGQLLFETTVPSVNVTVEPNGEVQTTGVVENGVFSVAGTVTDLFGNAGTWTFTLNATGPFTPQTTVTPYTPEQVTGIEIRVPFQIDPATGAVAYIQNYYEIIEQHVLTIVQTAQNERLMIPGYGAGLGNELFQSIKGAELARIQADIEAALASELPSVTIISLTADVTPGFDSTVTVQLAYSVVPFPNVQTVTVVAGGTVSEVIS